MTTAIYIRISSPKGQKTDSQRAELEAWLKRHRQASMQEFWDDSKRSAHQRLVRAVMAYHHEAMKLGYARVSTEDQNPDLQIQALKKAGCKSIYTDKVGGTVRKRPQLDRCLHALNAGDILGDFSKRTSLIKL